MYEACGIELTVYLININKSISITQNSSINFELNIKYQMILLLGLS